MHELIYKLKFCETACRRYTRLHVKNTLKLWLFFIQNCETGRLLDSSAACTRSLGRPFCFLLRVTSTRFYVIIASAFKFQVSTLRIIIAKRDDGRKRRQSIIRYKIYYPPVIMIASNRNGPAHQSSEKVNVTRRKKIKGKDYLSWQ